MHPKWVHNFFYTQILIKFVKIAVVDEKGTKKGNKISNKIDANEQNKQKTR